MSLALALALACGAPHPLVESRHGEAWQPEPFRVRSLGGQRDGALVAFRLILIAGDGRGLVVEGRLELSPQARLVSGTWREEGPAKPRSGSVAADFVDFLGGQGGRPSLGGRFVLSDGGDPAHRISLPTTVMDTASPNPPKA